jgi:hypothetical protein
VRPAFDVGFGFDAIATIAGYCTRAHIGAPLHENTANISGLYGFKI